MYSFNELTKRERYYLNRKKRLDEKFVWTQEKIQNLRELNDSLSLMQERIVEGVKKVSAVFSRLEADGMDFLHGFKVVGRFDFEKEIATQYLDADKPSKELKREGCKWDEIAFQTSREIDSWQLVFDSVSGDFLPLSKVRMEQKFKSWWLDFPDDTDFELCNYLNHFIRFNTTVSLEDLAECTGRDFSPDIFVVLGFPVNELECFSDFWGKDEKIGDVLLGRQNHLDHHFEWSEANIQKIMDVNGWVCKRSDELKRYMTELSDALKRLSVSDSDFTEFNIRGQIEYYGSESNDIATMELQKAMSKNAGFHFWSLSCDEQDDKVRDCWHDDKDEKLNWNFEVFRQHLSEDQQKVKFHYFMHTVFVDDDIYSLEDLVRMREENFKACMKINLWRIGNEKED